MFYLGLIRQASMSKHLHPRILMGRASFSGMWDFCFVFCILADVRCYNTLSPRQTYVALDLPRVSSLLLQVGPEPRIPVVMPCPAYFPVIWCGKRGWVALPHSPGLGGHSLSHNSHFFYHSGGTFISHFWHKSSESPSQSWVSSERGRDTRKRR